MCPLLTPSEATRHSTQTLKRMILNKRKKKKKTDQRGELWFAVTQLEVREGDELNRNIGT